MSVLLLDTGPLVALLSARDGLHRWAIDALAVKVGVVTCEAVLSEAYFLLGRGGRKPLSDLLRTGALSVAPLSNELDALTRLMTRYDNVPMSFADACLVRLSELYPKSVVATFDSDFHVYRRNGRQVIPLLTPRR